MRIATAVSLEVSDRANRGTVPAPVSQRGERL